MDCIKTQSQGMIIKAIGGLYTVESPCGILECKARGVFRNRGITPMVGDQVRLEENLITEVLKRKNCIIRPPLANLDQLLFVVSMCQPAPNLLLLDKFIAICEFKGISPVLVLTKLDLESHQQILCVYEKVGIRVMPVDYEKRETIEAVRDCLRGKISAFTGNSGVGKSTLLNALDENLALATGEISQKLGRGRHTTRHAQLYALPDGGYIADTPGFSTFETNQYDWIRKEELAGCFREFDEFADECRFHDCSHTAEKGCAVLAAVQNGDIAKSRHESYCRMFEEAKLIKEWERKS